MSTRNHPHRNRNGITITEALASIAVAAVGLFAVIAVIPFAARQSELGLDLDVSVAVGKNAFQEFDVRGFGNINRWRLPNIGGTPNVTPTPQYWPGKPFVIDPLFLTNNDPIINPQITVFPYVLYNNDENNINRIPPPTNPPLVGQPAFGIDRLNLASQNIPLTFAQAERIFRSANELLYDEAEDKLLPPNQQFSRDTLGNDLKRSYAGNISWMAMVVPEAGPTTPAQANPHNYRLYVIVFRGRQLNFLPTGPKGEAIFKGRLLFPPGPGAVSPNGGAIELEPALNAELPTGINNSLIQDDYVQTGDWILLTDYFTYQNNNLSDRPAPLDSAGRNWRWYQIQRVDPSVPSEQLGTLRATLVGPDWTGRDVQPLTPAIWDVHAIMMSNVVAVYEKTIRIEYESIWNN